MNNETEQIFLLNPTERQPSSAPQKPEETAVAPQDVEDFSTVCRTCATVTEFVIPIFDGEGLQNNLAEKIHKHLPIQVSETDVLPRVVCYQCASTLLAWHELVQCCVQADSALRQRLAVAAATDIARTKEIADPKTSSKEIVQNTEQEQNKFKEIAEFVVESLDPPQYPAGRPCAYCGASLPAEAYKEHLVAAHADHLFHCDECDTYVDRKDFILHMSLHAVEYAAKQDKKVPTEPIKRVKRVKKRKSEKDENENNEKARRKCTKRSKNDGDKSPDIRKSVESASDPLENEFSDHSDTEYGFGPLPESVFEAIEDSQDSQPPNDGEERPNGSSPSGDTENFPIDKSDASAESVEAEKSIDPPATKRHQKSRTCPICGKAYTASSSYFYHMKHSHRRSRDHECDVCGKKYGTKACLIQHKAIHSGERRYECKECGKRFRAAASLYIHSQTHGGEKGWSCAQCGGAFRWRAHLARHMLRHAAARAHVCEACGRGFSVRADLLRHARTHAAGDHACRVCGLKFAQVRYLKVHMDRKHADGEKPAEKENNN